MAREPRGTVVYWHCEHLHGHTSVCVDGSMYVWKFNADVGWCRVVYLKFTMCVCVCWCLCGYLKFTMRVCVLVSCALPEVHDARVLVSVQLPDVHDVCVCVWCLCSYLKFTMHTCVLVSVYVWCMVIFVQK